MRHGEKTKEREVECKKVEEILVYEHSLFRLPIDNIPDWIFFKDAESRLIRINKACAQLLGLADPQEAVGKTDFDFYPREIAQRFYAEEQKIIQSGEPIVARMGQTPTRDVRCSGYQRPKYPYMMRRGR